MNAPAEHIHSFSPPGTSRVAVAECTGGQTRKAADLMAYLKTVIKRLVVALCVLVLTGYVHACWVLARKLGEHEQVRMRPPSMRAYAQRGAPGPEWLRVCVHPGCVRTPSEAHRTRAAASTQHACVRPARRTGPGRHASTQRSAQLRSPHAFYAPRCGCRRTEAAWLSTTWSDTHVLAVKVTRLRLWF